jgi:hypothetical protein
MQNEGDPVPSRVRNEKESKRGETLEESEFMTLKPLFQRTLSREFYFQLVAHASTNLERSSRKPAHAGCAQSNLALWSSEDQSYRIRIGAKHCTKRISGRIGTCAIMQELQ